VKSHEQLSSALLVTEMISDIFENHFLEIAFIEMKNSIVPVLSNIVTVSFRSLHFGFDGLTRLSPSLFQNSPRTRKDKMIFVHILQYFTSYLARIPRDTLQENVLETIYHLVESFSVTLLPIITSWNNQQQPEQLPTNANAEKAFKYFLQKSYLEFLSVVSGFHSKDLMLDVLFLSNKMIHFVYLNHFVVRNAGDSDVPNNSALGTASSPLYFKYLATRILQNLLKYHDGLLLLQSLEEEIFYPNSNNHILSNNLNEQKLITQNRIFQISLKPLLRIQQVIKNMKTSESLLDSTLLLESLKLLYSYLQEEVSRYYLKKMNLVYMEYMMEDGLWQWLIRFLYDRRNEVRYISVEIISVLLPLVVQFRKEKEEFQQQPKPTTTESGEEEGKESSSANPQTFVQFEFPPIEQLYYLFNDEKECHFIRIKSLFIILKYHSSISRRNRSLTNTSSDFHVSFPRII
jgi:hypothetical protein